ncbi:hypothetical protein [Streptomyces sp. AC512_CC834]|uniref:hypothetical protein n=1 Tax=Streptomyces sp. AC512_CC834 TaxID=2823691 RepID=UPI0020B8A86C|nr:hypothetical protein [Streptomyces sp. AC512_CC834]
MAALLPFVILAGGLAVVLGLFTWLAVRIRRRGTAGGAMSAALASYEEAFRVTAHEAHVEIRAQTDRRAPLLSPDDHWGRGPAATDGDGAGTRRTTRRDPRRSRGGRLGRWFDRRPPRDHRRRR